MTRKLTIAIVSVLVGASIGFPVGRLTAPETTARVQTSRSTAAGDPVVRIIDGDTIDVSYLPPQVAVTERIPMLYIDTPERGERLYREATDALAALIGDSPVRLQFEDLGQPARGSYGRLLGYLYAGDTNLNVELVRRGFSPHFTKYGRGRLADQFDVAQNEAKTARRGIWRDGQPQP